MIGTLADIVEKSAGFKAPALIVVGAVVKLQRKLDWFTDKLTDSSNSVSTDRDEVSVRI